MVYTLLQVNKDTVMLMRVKIQISCWHNLQCSTHLEIMVKFTLYALAVIPSGNVYFI